MLFVARLARRRAAMSRSEMRERLRGAAAGTDGAWRQRSLVQGEDVVMVHGQVRGLWAGGDACDVGPGAGEGHLHSGRTLVERVAGLVQREAGTPGSTGTRRHQRVPDGFRLRRRCDGSAPGGGQFCGEKWLGTCMHGSWIACVGRERGDSTRFRGARADPASLAVSPVGADAARRREVA